MAKKAFLKQLFSKTRYEITFEK